MKRVLAVALLVVVAFAVGQFVGATGSDSSNEITSRKSMGIMQYDEADVKLDSGEADTTAWREAYSYVNCASCWIDSQYDGDSTRSQVLLQVRDRDHVSAVFNADTVTTALASGGMSYVCEQWTWLKPVKEFRFIRTSTGGVLGTDTLWVMEFRTYLGQE